MCAGILARAYQLLLAVEQVFELNLPEQCFLLKSTQKCITFEVFYTLAPVRATSI